MKRAQIIGQVFIYTMAAITFALILLFGYRIVNGVVNQGNDIALIQMRQDMQSAINSIGASPDVKKLDINVPSRFRKICFLGGRAVRPSDKIRSCLCEDCRETCAPWADPSHKCYGGNESDYNAIICSAWKTGTKQNVYLVPNANLEITVSNITFRSDRGMDVNYLCLTPKRGKVTLRLQGMGDNTQLSEWKI